MTTYTASPSLMNLFTRSPAFSKEGTKLSTLPLAIGDSTSDTILIPAQYTILQILEVIENSTGYVTAEYVTLNLKNDIDDIKKILDQSPNFLKSFIKGSKGQDVYYIKKPFSRLKDLWNSFRHLNSQKY